MMSFSRNTVLFLFFVVLLLFVVSSWANPNEPIGSPIRLASPSPLPYLVSYCHGRGAANESSPVIIVVPGGAYRAVAVASEGKDVADFLSKSGFCVYVYVYTTPPVSPMGPTLEMDMALDYIHKQHRWRRVCLLGFSAGGHLVGISAVHGRHTIQAVGMVYPVVSMYPPITHNLSRTLLLQKVDPPADLLEKYSLDRLITPCFPATFLLHGMVDTTVPYENSVRLAKALKAANVTYEFISSPRAGHGFGMRMKRMRQSNVVNWPFLLRAWLWKQ